MRPHGKRFCEEWKKNEDLNGSKSGSGGKINQGEKEKEQELGVLEVGLQEVESNKKEEGISGSLEDSVSTWATVPLAKVGRSSPGRVSEVLISASKLSVTWKK